MDPNSSLLRHVVESVIRELDDDALSTLQAYGIKGTPSDVCGCPVAKYVATRMEEMYETTRTGLAAWVGVYFDMIEVTIHQPVADAPWYRDTVIIRDTYSDMGAFAFVHRFDAEAPLHPDANRYAELIG